MAKHQQFGKDQAGQDSVDLAGEKSARTKALQESQAKLEEYKQNPLDTLYQQALTRSRDAGLAAAGLDTPSSNNAAALLRIVQREVEKLPLTEDPANGVDLRQIPPPKPPRPQIPGNRE